METANFIYLGIGSNLGDRLANIIAALNKLAINDIQTLRCSSIYETPAWGFEAEETFYNCVLECTTAVSAFELLNVIKTIEKELGRTLKTSSEYTSRTIDIDILLYKNDSLSTNGLTIPHQHLSKRNFVLYPLVELIPSTCHPVEQLSFSDLLKNSPDKSEITIVKPLISFRNLSIF
jgi:2-amino-4-hydroxy-6-hydroxymethyldihydropteridine diphosphokinase